MAALKDLQEKRQALAVQIRELGNKQAEWTAEHEAKWGTLNTEYDAIQAAMTAERERLAKDESVQKRLAEIEETNKRALEEGRVGLDAGRRREENPERVEKIDTRAIAMQAWLRAGKGIDLTDEHRDVCKKAGVNPYSPEFNSGNPDFRYAGPSWCTRGTQKPREFRAGLDVATGGAGQETIPTGFLNELEAVTLAYASVRNVARILRTATGNAMPMPTVDDTGNTGALLAEATTIGTSVDPTFAAAATLHAFKYTSQPVFCSSEILRDSAFNLASEIAMMLGERLGRREAIETTTGAGTTRCKGVVTCAGTGVTSGAATVITSDELIDLYHSLDPSNRVGASVGWMFHDTCLKYFRKLKDADGQYLWQPGLMAGEPDTLYGKPVTINQSMEPLVSNLPVTAKKHVLFGDYSKFIIRLVGNDRFFRLDERYRDTDQTAFICFREMDSNTNKVSALKVLLQA